MDQSCVLFSGAAVAAGEGLPASSFPCSACIHLCGIRGGCAKTDEVALVCNLSDDGDTRLDGVVTDWLSSGLSAAASQPV